MNPTSSPTVSCPIFLLLVEDQTSNCAVPVVGIDTGKLDDL